MKRPTSIFLAISLLVLWSAANSHLVLARKSPTVGAQQTSRPLKHRLTLADNVFLEDLEHRAFLYFWEHSDAETGLTLDRAGTNGDAPPPGTEHHRVASIAATGFALTSYCIAATRNWKSGSETKERTRRTLRFFATRAVHQDGWFYHWMDQRTGERRWQSEISSVDTALLLGGVLTVRQCFADDREIVNLATKIYQRVNFKWMLNGDQYLLSHGWHPETGFIKNRWHDYSESSIIYLLGTGSPTHPLPWRSWYAWERTYVSYQKYRYLAAVSPLFIHQYSHAWIDFRGRREHFQKFKTNYFENSIIATRAQRQFFIDVLSREFPHYNENIWGLTASDSAKGYLAWGGPPRDPATDGSVVPCAAGGSLMFAPDIALPALQSMKTSYGDKIYGRYGFADAFNPQTNWVDADVIGIDVGVTLLSAENLRSQNVWNWFMRNNEIKLALKKTRIT